MTGFWTGLFYVLGGVFLFMVITSTVYMAVQQLRLRRHRGVSREQFIEAFRDLGITKAVPAAVYDYYRSVGMWEDFSVSPSDSFSKILSGEPEEVEEAAEHLTKQLGIRLPPEYILQQWDKPVETLRDMVLWLDWVRQHQIKADS